MKLEHIAIWTKDLERLKSFYETYFQGVAGERYHNSKNQFYSYFLRFEGGARLELMQMAGIPENRNDTFKQFLGLIHFAFATGSPENVNSLTNKLRSDGYTIVGEPRWTGDGYYESVVLDPDGNRIEIVG
ncbi:VOC family protein [Fulvivirgaceae bacterium BMA12]|uniref:VOC family protein n=1 Tax=Agaribacillus aureus TaxID=3051825 RepID=A0ABT8LHC9_9BACT|nr:VOC family protein [Fulvivirgaceae bacterium BMA12]